MNYQRVKGMEDYYPTEEATRQAVLAKLRESAKRFGFQEVSSPMIETTKLLTAKSGEEVKEQLFNCEKKSKEEISLRFDLTVPMTRMFVAKQREMQKPAKWFALDRMYRYESPQKGRKREFYQLSVEMFGSDKPEAEADVLNLAIACLKSFGLNNKQVVFKINNRKLLEGLLKPVIGKADMEEVVRVIDKVAKITPEEFRIELSKVNVPQKDIETVCDIASYKGGLSVIEDIEKNFPMNPDTVKGIEELRDVLKFLDKSWFEIDLSIARGLAYYTGNVFECVDTARKFSSILGGGRYDNLVGIFGGEETPATGFGLGFERLSLVLEDLGLMPSVSPGPEYFIAPVKESLLFNALELAAKLREKTSVDVDLMRRSLSKQFDYANSIGAKKVIVLGEKELNSGKATIKELASGKETQVDMKKL